jgi:phage shock protein C
VKFTEGGTMKKRLYRSRDERIIWGVCGGIAKYFDVDPTLIRLVAVLTLFFAFTGILIYIILTIIMPLEPGNP